MHYIYMQQEFTQPVEQIFAQFADHENFGRIVGANISRIVDAPGKDPNGLGSVRKISAFPGLTFEETICQYNKNEVIAYRVSKGSPVKDHEGRLLFCVNECGCSLEYSIQFRPKLAIPFWGKLLKFAIQFPIKRGLKHLALRSHSRSDR